jgi:hypothetical protein
MADTEDKGIVKPNENDEIVVDEEVDQPGDDGDGAQVKEPEYTKIELEALEMGWKPKSEFDGEEDDFIDAKEFVRRQPLFDKIESNSKELKAVRKALEQFKKHYGSVEQAAYQRALNELKAARREALTNSDGDAFDKFDDQIKKVEADAAAARIVAEQPVAEEPQVPQEFILWKQKNTWYDRKEHMRVYADKLGIDFRNQGLNPQQILNRVETEIRSVFPHEFRNPNKDNAPDVESSRKQQPRSNGKDSEYPLSQEERQTMMSFERQGVMTRQEYIKSLREVDAAQGIKRN